MVCEQTCWPRSPTRALGSATAPATTFNATQHSAKSVRGAPDTTSLTRAPRPGKADARSRVLEERGWSSFLSRPLNDTENAESCRAFGMARSLHLCHGDSRPPGRVWPGGGLETTAAGQVATKAVSSFLCLSLSFLLRFMHYLETCCLILKCLGFSRRLPVIEF